MKFLFFFLILSNIFEKYISLIGYLDEIITICALLLIIVKINVKQKLSKNIFDAAICFFIVICVGVLSNIIFDIQKSKIAIMKDILAISKFFIIYICCCLYPNKRLSRNQNELICKFSKVYIITLFIFGIINQFFDIGMDSGYRSVVKVFMFLYSHSTYMVGAVVVICTILIADGMEKNINFIICAIIVLMLSMRSKAYIYIVLISFFFLLMRRNKMKISAHSFLKRNKQKIFLMAVFVMFISYFVVKDKLNDYIRWGLSAARTALYIVGFKIMIDYFPLGTGLGTFASWISGEYYSNVYVLYNIQNVSGLRRDEGMPYISDTYWPYIFGQFGIIGMFFYAMALIYVFKDILKKYSENINVLVSAVSLYVYILMACFVEATLTNAQIVLMALTLGYYLEVKRG